MTFIPYVNILIDGVKKVCLLKLSKMLSFGLNQKIKDLYTICRYFNWCKKFCLLNLAKMLSCGPNQFQNSTLNLLYFFFFYLEIKFLFPLSDNKNYVC